LLIIIITTSKLKFLGIINKYLLKYNITVEDAYLPGFKTEIAACTALHTKLSRANIQWGLMLCNRNTALA